LLKIFSYAFTRYSGLIVALHKGTAAYKSIGFLKIGALHDVSFTSKSSLSFLNGCGAIWREIRLKRNDWRKMKKLNLKR